MLRRGVTEQELCVRRLILAAHVGWIEGGDASSTAQR